MNKRKWIRHLTRIKENLNLIILVPTIVGGFWQILELSSISTSYIRFFSFTQLVADGILILFIISLIYFTIRLGVYFFTAKSMKPFVGLSDSPPTLMDIIMTFAMPVMIIVFARHEMKSLFLTTPKNLSGILNLILASIILFGLILLGFIKIFLYLLFIYFKRKPSAIEKFKTNSEISKKILSYSTKIIVYALLFFIILSIPLKILPALKNCRSSILLPEQLINVKLMNESIKKQYKLKSNPKILYFNDSYLFYKLETDSNNSQILILKTEKLFDIEPAGNTRQSVIAAE